MGVRGAADTLAGGGMTGCDPERLLWLTKKSSGQEPRETRRLVLLVKRRRFLMPY